MLDNYSEKIQAIFAKHKIEIGQRIAIVKEKERYEGFLLPKSAGDENLIVIKLDNGYNVGITFSEKVQIHKLDEKRAPKKADIHIKKHKPDTQKKTIAMIHTGGTVASRIDYKTGAVTTATNVEDVYAAVPELSEIANIRTCQLFQAYSQDLEMEHWIALARTIQKEIEEGADGIIVTHGTDILHYTSAALSFIIQNVPIPVLLVGSQRSTDRGSNDAALNLICAAHFIAKSDFAGVAICMHGSSSDDYCYVHDSTNVRKMHTSRRDTFRSIDVLPYAKVFPDGQIEYLRSDYPRANGKILQIADKMEKAVAIIKSRPGFSYRELEMYVNAGYKGLVIEGTGLGHLPNETHDEYTQEHTKINDTIKKLTEQGIVILVVSQCSYGRVNLNVYAPQRALLEAGAIAAAMTPETAFAKLSWIMGQTKNREEIIKMLNTNYCGEIVERIDSSTFLQ